MSSSVAGVKVAFVAVASPFIVVAGAAPPFRVAIAPQPATTAIVEAAPTPGAVVASVVAQRTAFVVESPVRATIVQE